VCVRLCFVSIQDGLEPVSESTRCCDKKVKRKPREGDRFDALEGRKMGTSLDEYTIFLAMRHWFGSNGRRQSSKVVVADGRVDDQGLFLDHDPFPGRALS